MLNPFKEGKPAVALISGRERRAQEIFQREAFGEFNKPLIAICGLV